MNNKFSRAALAFVATSFISSLAYADNLGQFDARSLAMGGAGVAGAQSANAAAYNPALMATEANKKRFAINPLVLKIDAYDENDFIDTTEDVEKAVNGTGGLEDLLNGMDDIDSEAGCDPLNDPDAICFQHVNMEPTSDKATETKNHLTRLNSSNALLGVNTGLALQFGNKLPMAFIVDGGANLRVGVKFAGSDLDELTAYTDKMRDGNIDGNDFIDLANDGYIDNNSNSLNFTRGDNNSPELRSMIEVIGATYYEMGLSFADGFQYAGKELAIGITPKIVKVEAIKYHQSVETEDIETDDILDDDNIVSKTDFNADIGLAFKPLDTQPLQVGIAVKNLFTRSYNLKKSAQEIVLETEAAGAGPAAVQAQSDLKKFKFRQELAIEPQLTAGIAYDLRFFNFLADIDLNEAEVLGRTTQHIALGAEFDAKLLKLQVGYRTAIGGDNEDDTISAGTTLGFLDLAVISAGDHIGGVIQTSIAF